MAEIVLKIHDDISIDKVITLLAPYMLKISENVPHVIQ